jgi:hypothetical protein
MAHYAILDENNIVIQVIVGKDENEPLPDGYDSWEQYYGGKRTSFNTIGNVHLNGGKPFRKNYAGIGFYYDEEWDAFRPTSKYPSWKLNYETFLWEPPVPQPEPIDGYHWVWGEINKEWVKVAIPQN